MIGVRVAIGDLENSYEVLPSRKDTSASMEYLRKSPFLQPGSPDLFTITSHIEFDTAMADNRFAPDIRSFGLIVLEMLVAMSEHNQKMKMISQSQRLTRSVDDLHYQNTRRLEVQSVQVRVPEGHSHVHSHDGIECTCSTNVTDVRAFRDTKEYTTAIPAVDNDRSRYHDEAITVDRHNPTDQQDHTHLQVHSTPYSQCRYEHSTDSHVQPKVVTPLYQSVTKLRRPSLDSSRSLQWSTPVIEIHESRDSDTDSIIDPRARPGSRSRISPRRGVYKQILTNGSFLATPRTTPEPLSVIDRHDIGTGTVDLSTVESPLNTTPVQVVASTNTDNSTNNAPCDTNSEEEEDTPPPLPERGQPSPPIVQRRGFQTIYEEEDTSKADTLKAPETENVTENLFTTFIPKKRRMPPPPPPPISESGQTKRLSIASMDESVVSADSGVGSSHYDNYSTASGGTDHSSSYYLRNITGSRDTVYTAESTTSYAASSVISETDSYAYMNHYMSGKNRAARTMDSGIESNDDLSKCDMSVDGDDTHSDHMLDNVSEAPESLYEKLPDIEPRHSSPRKGKQPCIGHHDHVSGKACKLGCTGNITNRPRHPSPETVIKDNQQTNEDLKPIIPPKPFMLKPKIPPKPQHLVQIEKPRQNLEEQWRQLVDKATNTTPPSSSPEPELEAIMNSVSSSTGCQTTASLCRSSGSTPWYHSRSREDDKDMAVVHGIDRYHTMVEGHTNPAFTVAPEPWYIPSAHNIKGLLPDRPLDLPFHFRKDSYDTDISESTTDTPRGTGQHDEYERRRLYKRNYDPHYGSRTRHIHRKSGLSRPISGRSSSTSSSPMSIDRTDSDNLSIATSTFSEPGCHAPYHITSEPRIGIGQKHVQYCAQLADSHSGINARTMLSADQDQVHAMMNSVKDTGKLGFVAGQVSDADDEDCDSASPVPTSDNRETVVSLA